MDTRKEALKYVNKWFKNQFLTDKDREVRSLIRLLNKAKKQKPSAE